MHEAVGMVMNQSLYSALQFFHIQYSPVAQNTRHSEQRCCPRVVRSELCPQIDIWLTLSTCIGIYIESQAYGMAFMRRHGNTNLLVLLAHAWLRTNERAHASRSFCVDVSIITAL